MKPEDSLRELIARAIYDTRPFATASRGGVLEMMCPDPSPAWESAPGWYRDDCYELADGVLARLLLAQAGDAGAGLDPASRKLWTPIEDSKLRAIAGRRGAAKQLARELGRSPEAIYARLRILRKQDPGLSFDGPNARRRRRREGRRYEPQMIAAE